MLSFVHVVGLLLYVPINSYGHVGMVSTPNHSIVQTIGQMLKTSI